MTQSFVAASFNMEVNKRLMLIHYICFLSSHEVMIKTDKGKKGGVPPKTVRFLKKNIIIYFVLFYLKSFINLEVQWEFFTRLCF